MYEHDELTELIEHFRVCELYALVDDILHQLRLLLDIIDEQVEVDIIDDAEIDVHCHDDDDELDENDDVILVVDVIVLHHFDENE